MVFIDRKSSERFMFTVHTAQFQEIVGPVFVDKECENKTFGDVSVAANTFYFIQNSLTADNQAFVDVELKL